MKKTKLLLVSCLVIVFVFGFSVAFATMDNSQSNNTGQNQEENNEQNQNQNQNQNQGKDVQNQEQENEQEGIENETKASVQVNGELHRSTVSDFVQGLLKVASRSEGGIGEQVRVIAQEQNQNKERVADQIEAIERRNKFKTFLIGTDYKNVGALRSEMVQTRNRLEELNRLIEQATNDADKTELQNQIQTMEEEQTKIETLLKKAEGKFSLLGWLVKLFNKD